MSKKKKIIIVSIGAVVILILVSFTNVVGIQSATSESVNDSPLFSIRTNTATNNEKNRVITFDYLGKGLNAIPFPLRDNRTALLQKVIGIIQKMDDKKFNRFQSLILSRFYKEIPKELDINQFDIISNDTHPPTLDTCWIFQCYTIGDWTPGCLLSKIFFALWAIAYYSVGITLSLIYYLVGITDLLTIRPVCQYI